MVEDLLKNNEYKNGYTYERINEKTERSRINKRKTIKEKTKTESMKRSKQEKQKLMGGGRGILRCVCIAKFLWENKKKTVKRERTNLYFISGTRDLLF